VAVTGATGFIGRALCRRLAAAHVPVRALVRRSGAELPVGVIPVLGSLASASALNELVRGARVVVHLAGAVRGADRAAFDAVNVAGTRELLATIGARAPKARLVHVSSLAAREPGLSDYAASKRAAETLLDGERTFSSVVLRPTAVYGPGDEELAPLLRTMARGLAPIPADPSHRVTLIHVDDVVEAILAAAAAPDPGPGPYELADERTDGYRWDELVDAVARASGRTVRRVTVPRAVLAAAGSANRAAARLLARAPMLTPGKVRELCHPDWSCDTAPFRDATGWAPGRRLQDGLADLLAAGS
jgi:nucleoside-diphosphate-sugar epimerase